MAKNLNQTCFSENILAIDLEILPGGAPFHIGAVFRDKSFERKNISCAKTALRDLSDFSKEADYILGHNIAKHDLPAVKAIMPDASFLTLPVIDTLFLSPLAFPENPYHKLIKNYKPVKNSKNDPVADARLAMAVFDDQMAAFLALHQAEPRLTAFYAFGFENEVSLDEKFGLEGISRVFQNLSGHTPKIQEAKTIFQEQSRGKVCETGLEKIWETATGSTGRRAMLAYVLSWI